jgi:hypothetical protein
MSTNTPLNTPLPPTPPTLPTTTPSVPAASNRLYDIPSLKNDGLNFATWKFRITTVLDIRGLNTVVNGSCLRPQQSASDYCRNYTMSNHDSIIHKYACIIVIMIKKTDHELYNICQTL